MAKKVMKTPNEEKRSKFAWVSFPRLEGAIPYGYVIDVLLGYSIGYTSRYTRSAIKWLLLARNRGWNANTFSDSETIGMRELYHVLYCRNTPFVFIAEVVIAHILSASLIIFYLRKLKRKQSFIIRRLQITMNIGYILIYSLVVMPMTIYLNHNSTMSKSNPFLLSDTSLWGVFNGMSSAIVLMSAMLVACTLLHSYVILSGIIDNQEQLKPQEKLS